MRYLLVILVALAFAPVAQAQVIEGTNSGEVLVGTEFGDKIYGYGGADTLRGKAGGDLLKGGNGEDSLECGIGRDEPVGGPDDDLIFCNADDGKADVIDCGGGEDLVFWYAAGSVIFTNCEHVFRQAPSSGDQADAEDLGGMAFWCYYTEGDGC